MTHHNLRRLPWVLIVLILSACAHEKPFPDSSGHISESPAGVPSEVPQPIKISPSVPLPKPAIKAPTYSVVVNEVPVKDLLFALARDTKLNIDVHPSIQGVVTINAINETLPAILDRIANQVDIRYRLEGDTLVITPDTPYVKTYTVNYVNLTRDTSSSIGVATQISSTGSNTTTGGTPSASSGNSSSTTVTSSANNNFWDMLTTNTRDILRSTRKAAQSAEDRAARAEAVRASRDERIAQVQAASRAGANATTLFNAAFGNSPTPALDNKDDVIVNPIAGTVTVMATEAQHKLVQQYLDRVQAAVRRQVLIEATIVEVSLKDQYRTGIDWKRVAKAGGAGFVITPGSTATTNLADTLSPFLTVGYTNANNGFDATISLLESFGKTRVLSSPKLMALNNQTALLKVVDNLVYFSIDVQQGTTYSSGVTAPSTYTSTAHSIPVGVVMALTPQIDASGNITLVVRPTISRKNGEVSDPNPALTSGIKNNVPVIQVREMESVLQLTSGQTAILGGLMQDDASKNRDALPGLSRNDGLLGFLFGQREDQATQTELVIFLRPTLINNPSLDSGELSFYRRYLPQPEQPAKP